MADMINEQRYGPTSGTLTGWLGLVTCGVLLVWLPLSESSARSWRWAFVAGLIGVLVWAFLLRPRVIVLPADLVLRNAFSSWLVPLVGVEKVAVGAITRIKTTAGRTYDGLGVGRSARPGGGRSSRAPGGGFAPPADPGIGFEKQAAAALRRTGRTPTTIPSLMTEQIFAAVDRAREAGLEDGPTRRLWAWPEIAAAVAFAAAVGVTYL